MNKKITVSLLSTMALGTLVFANGSTAEATDKQTHMDTTTGISFYDTNKPNPGPFEGYLSFVYAPGNIDFGSHEINGSSATYIKTYEAMPTKQKYVAVSDDRAAADKKGWELVAKLGEFTDEQGNVGLENAELSFNAQNTKKYVFDAAESDILGTPTPAVSTAGSLVDLTTDAVMKDLYTVTPRVMLTSGATAGAKTVITSKTPDAASDASGTMAVATEINDPRLTIKDHNGVNKKTFKSTIFWNLTADPQP